MKNSIKSNKFYIIAILIVALAAAGISVYRDRSTKLLDKEAYAEFRDSVNELRDKAEEEGLAFAFEDQEALRSFIMDWADSKGLAYSEDSAGNIIFERKAAARKSRISPTVILVSMNYESAGDNGYSLASAASIALAELDSGKKTVIFVNDEQNLGKGYKALSDDLISSKAKVIYLDGGASPYLSTASFTRRFSEAGIEAEREDAVCDSAVKIRISGITSGVVGPGIGKQPDPVSALGTLLNRLKSKSATYRLADVQVESNGNMYPVSMEATIMLNSYALSSFTSYIDKRIKAWDKAYGEGFEDLSYTYEVIENEEDMPKTAYTQSTTDKLAQILYTIKTGTYRYAESDVVPDNREVGDVYGINCLVGLEATDKRITIKILTQGADKTFTDRIYFDNKAAVELYDCSIKETESIPAFVNDRDSLSRTFRNTYFKVNDPSNIETELPYETDNYFTPCSYIAELNPKADIIHIKLSGKSAQKISNTILCYIKTKGNTSLF